jgi:D-aspartate ligase
MEMPESSQDRVTSSGSETAAFVLGGGVNALAVARSLGRKRIPVTLVSGDRRDLARRSRYVTSFQHASDDPDELVQALLDLGQTSDDRPVLYFTADKYLELVSTHRDRLAGCFRFIVSDEQAVLTVLSKGQFNRFTEETGFPAPRGLIASERTQWVDGLEALNYPIVAKPLLSYEWRAQAFVDRFGRTKAIQFEGPGEVKRTLTELLEFTSEVLIQELILGHDSAHYSVLVYRSPRHGELFRLCVNKARVWPIRNGAGSYARVSSDARMENVAADLLEKLGWVGMASVCFKVDSRAGQPMIHEVNGRLPQFHGIVQAAGVDLPYLMYLDTLGADIPAIPVPLRSATYRIIAMDCAALRAYRRAGELTRREMFRCFIQRDGIAEFAWDDPAPFLGMIRSGLSSVMRGIFRRSRPSRSQP